MGQEGRRAACGGCHIAGEERWQVRPSRGMHDQDAREARNQGGQEGGLRQGGYGEGEAGEDCREGLPRFRLEEAVLRASLTTRLATDDTRICPWVCHGRLVRQP